MTGPDWLILVETLLPAQARRRAREPRQGLTHQGSQLLQVGIKGY